MKKKKYIKYTKERVILSDVLPYEIPITFSNRHLYKFLSINNISFSDGKFMYKSSYSDSDTKGFIESLKLLFDISNITSKTGSIDVNPMTLKKIPFSYRILHKESDFRELTIIHPKNQLALIEFYKKYKELIIFYCNISNYSIRKPVSVAKFVFFNDKLHHLNAGEKDDFLELHGKEYENLKTFFSYKKYTNIYRFYEDYRYQRAEKKFKALYKFDISKCFDSIYSHSIVWAILNKETVKHKIPASLNTFGGAFDKFIQNANYGETNGIVIGPEFSRIFAEIILQRIDFEVELKLKEHNLHNRKDYEIYRYVDDYFVFCDSEQTKDIILNLFRHQLKEYKLALNDAKSKSYIKPMVTEISIAKMKIHQLFDKEPICKITKIENVDSNSESENEIKIIQHQFNYYINPNKLALKFKIIVKESNVEYKDILNYALAIINNKIERVLVNFDELYEDYTKKELQNILANDDKVKKNKLEIRFTEFIIGYVDFVFFLFTVSPRVNSTIKLCHILSKIIKFFNGEYKFIDLAKKNKRFNEINREALFKKISDDISLVLSKNQIQKHAQIEVIYLLIVLKELGKRFRLNHILLAKHFRIYDKEKKEISIEHLNYFGITTLLYYISDIKIYEEIKTKLLEYIIKYVSNIDSDKRKKNTEFVLLALDISTCPYIPKEQKKRILSLYGLSDVEAENIIDFKKQQKYWFTKWQHFDLSKELNSKTSLEGYS